MPMEIQHWLTQYTVKYGSEGVEVEKLSFRFLRILFFIVFFFTPVMLPNCIHTTYKIDFTVLSTPYVRVFWLFTQSKHLATHTHTLYTFTHQTFFDGSMALCPETVSLRLLMFCFFQILSFFVSNPRWLCVWLVILLLVFTTKLANKKINHSLSIVIPKKAGNVKKTHSKKGCQG